MPAKNNILTPEVALLKMQRMALEIAEELQNETQPLIVIGINGSGMVVAGKIYRLLQPLLSTPMQLITCNINKKQPVNIGYSQQMDFSEKNILLVDDVTNSGRTLLYAIKPLLEFFPRRILTAALVERLHKSFPVHINYIGLSIASTLHEHIAVEVAGDEVTGAYMQ